jgi:uncharacterized protein YukE
MTLPKAVVSATEELAAMEQQLQAPAPETPPPDGQTEPPPQPQPSPEPEPTPPVASADEPPPPQEPEEKWEHKYRRLQGKYDAEVPRLHQHVRELQAAIQQMQQQMQAPPPPPAAEKPAEPERYVSDEDVVNYGADFVDIQRRIALDATRELRKQVDELKAQLAQTGQAVQQTGQVVNTVTFEQKLLDAVPDFRTINNDPAWVAWLNEVDPILRGPRRLVAQAAYQRADVEAVKGYVDLFKQTRQAPPAKPEIDREQELRRQVQPSRSAPSAPVNAQKTYTLQEADNLFHRMQQLTAQGRIEEAKRLDAEISTAYAEGRVVV